MSLFSGLSSHEVIQMMGELTVLEDYITLYMCDFVQMFLDWGFTTLKKKLLV